MFYGLTGGGVAKLLRRIIVFPNQKGLGECTKAILAVRKMTTRQGRDGTANAGKMIFICRNTRDLDEQFTQLKLA